MKFNKNVGKGLQIFGLIIAGISMVVGMISDGVKDEITVQKVDALLDKRLGPGVSLHEMDDDAEEDNTKANG